MTFSFSTIRQFLRRHYTPLNHIYLNRKALINNFEYLSSLNDFSVAPVLKSNGYGHGITLVGQTLDSLGAPFFCVDSLFEAYQLKKAGIKTPILIMGYIDPHSLQVGQLPFSFAVFNFNLAQVLAKHQPGAKIHLFIDTGMHREGIQLDQLPAFLEQLKKLNLKVEGVMSHFASADQPEKSQTQHQESAFQLGLEMIKDAGFNPNWIHISASAGLFTSKNLGCNTARTGKALYGLSPVAKPNPKLQLALKLTSKLVDIKYLQPGDLVGYGGTYKVTKPTPIGILPIGYNDGVDRRLSNKGVVTVKGKECPIVGRVSMNITAVDLTKVENPRIGDEVIVFSDQSDDPNSIANAAKVCETIPYDLMVHLNPITIRRELI